MLLACSWLALLPTVNEYDFPEAFQPRPKLKSGFNPNNRGLMHDNLPSIEVIVKLAKAFVVSVDFLLGEGLNAAYHKEMVKRLDELESLPADEKQRILHYMDLIIREYKTKKLITINEKSPASPGFQIQLPNLCCAILYFCLKDSGRSSLFIFSRYLITSE